MLSTHCTSDDNGQYSTTGRWVSGLAQALFNGIPTAQKLIAHSNRCMYIFHCSALQASMTNEQKAYI